MLRGPFRRGQITHSDFKRGSFDHYFIEPAVFTASDGNRLVWRAQIGRALDARRPPPAPLAQPADKALVPPHKLDRPRGFTE